MKTASMATTLEPTAQSSSKPKILHIVKDQKVGGVKSTLSGLVTHLAADFDFTVLVAGSDRPALKSWRLQPAAIVWHQPCRLMELPRLVLLKLLNPRAQIVIHEHGYSQGYEQFNVRSVKRFHWMLRLFFTWVDQVVAISQAQANWMLRHRLVHPSKLTVITQCPPLQRFFAVTPKPIDQPVVLAAYGRFCFHKGFDVLLKALRQMPDLPIQLYLAGEGEQEAELRRLAEGLTTVKFVGRVDDVPAFLQQCDAVVIPSRWEPWGNVCLEAKAAGKPLIACSVDGLTEQVQQCGLLVEPNCPEKLATAIEQFVSLPEHQLREWGEHGRQAVVDSDQRYFAAWRSFFGQVSRGKAIDRWE
jgi:glycosyltransferase involved in cell wall biosynthesis